MPKEKPRRDYRDGSIYQRESDGRWTGSFIVDGKRRYVYGKTRPEAKKKLEDAKRKAEQGLLVAASKQTLSEFIDYWLNTISKSIEATTVESYRNHTQRTRDVLGHIQIQKLKRDHIQRFINGLTEELAVSTIRQMFAILEIALNAAVEWKALSESPCAGVILPKLVEAEQAILTAEEAQHLLKFARGHALEPFIALALGTAMRKGEICALKWSDIDFEKNIIRVERKVYSLRHPDGHYRMTPGIPKSKSSKRTLPLAGFVKEVLLRHRKKQLAQRMLVLDWEENDLVFCGPGGKFFLPSSLHRSFKNLLKAAGLPDVKIHGLRHSCNTLLRMMGVDPVTRQKIMGHAQLRETEGTYGHTYLEMKQQAMEKLDRLFLDDEPNSQAN
jgi:integrase